MSLVDLGKQLLESAKLGETEDVRLLMTNGAPFTTDWLGFSPLHLAAQYGHLDTAEVLLRAGISRDARTKVDRTPLHVAAQEGHIDVVELLITHGADVDAVDMLKMTPLHWAVERGHYHTASLLLKQNANPTLVNKFDKSPVDIAEDNDNKRLSELLKRHSVEFPSIKTEASASKTVKMLISKTNSPNVSSVRVYSKLPLTQGSLADLQKATVTNPPNKAVTSSDSEEGETPEPSCTSTNVLATLAALAAATAPNASISSADALHWLESHGIQMLPPDNSSIIASAVEGGQTVALTEAGKLALTFVKEHQSLNNSSSSQEETFQSLEKVPSTTGSSPTNQKVITIVADQSQIPSIITSPQTPIVLINGQTVSTSVVDSSSPVAKKVKLSSLKKKPVVNGKVSSSQISSEESTTEKLKKELENVRKQAELYKAQMIQKAHEAELYKRQLEEMRTLPRVNQ